MEITKEEEKKEESDDESENQNSEEDKVPSDPDEKDIHLPI